MISFLSTLFGLCAPVLFWLLHQELGDRWPRYERWVIVDGGFIFVTFAGLFPSCGAGIYLGIAMSANWAPVWSALLALFTVGLTSALMLRHLTAPPVSSAVSAGEKAMAEGMFLL